MHMNRQDLTRESWKVTVQYLNSGSKDHEQLIKDFDAAFDKYADALG